MAELRVKGTGTIKLFESDNTSSVTIASPASLGGDRTITLPDASVTLASGTMLATDGSGASLTALNASELGSGTVPTARLGSGTASSSTVLYGDQTYKAEPTGGKVLQVSSANTTATVASSSSSYSAFGNGMDLSLTPSSTSNYFLIMSSTNFDIVVDDRQGNYGLWRQIDGSGNVSLGQMIQMGGAQTKAPGAFIYKDSPSTTGVVNYRLTIRATDSVEVLFGGYFGANTNLTIMEIAG
jgi:hypothetical protein